MAFLDETGVTQLTSDIKNLADAAYTKQNVVASAYNESSTYAVGDYCVYGGQLYRCTTAITTAGAWNPTRWTSTTVTDEFDRVGAVYVIEASASKVVYDPSVTTGSKFNPTSVTFTFYTITNGTKASLTTNFSWSLGPLTLDDDHQMYMQTGRSSSATVNFTTCPDADGTYKLEAQIQDANHVALAKCFVPIVFAGAGVPDGGTAGQLLAKNSAADYDTTWINAPSSLPSGGTAGQVLTKNSSTAGDAQWSTIYTLPNPNSGNVGQIAQITGSYGNRQWSLANFSSASICLVTFTQNGSTITCNKTKSEIISEIDAGHTVIASLDNSGYCYTLYGYGPQYVNFAKLEQNSSANGGPIYLTIIKYMADNTLKKETIGSFLYGHLNEEHVIKLGYEGGETYHDDPQSYLTNELYIQSVSSSSQYYTTDVILNFELLSSGGDYSLPNITLQYGDTAYPTSDKEAEIYRCTHFVWKPVQTTDPDYDESWMPDYIDGYGGLMRGELTFKVLSEHNSSEVIKTFKIKTYTFTWGPEIDDYYMYRTITYTETPLGGQSASGVSF